LLSFLRKRVDSLDDGLQNWQIIAREMLLGTLCETQGYP